MHFPSATEISVAKELKESIEIHLARSLTRRAMVKWSTPGHSTVDVNLIAYGPNIESLYGIHDNTEIGQFIAEQLELDLPAIADKLNDPANELWLTKSVGRDKVQGGVRPEVKVKKRSHGIVIVAVMSAGIFIIVICGGIRRRRRLRLRLQLRERGEYYHSKKHTKAAYTLPSPMRSHPGKTEKALGVVLEVKVRWSGQHTDTDEKPRGTSLGKIDTPHC